MLKKIFFILIMLTLCLAPLTGCDQTSTTPETTPTAVAPQQPVHLDLDGDICQVKVDSDENTTGKQDFVMNVVCNGQELFHIDLDGQTTGGKTDGVNVDVFGKNFLNWGTRK